MRFNVYSLQLRCVSVLGVSATHHRYPDLLIYWNTVRLDLMSSFNPIQAT